MQIHHLYVSDNWIFVTTIDSSRKWQVITVLLRQKIQERTKRLCNKTNSARVHLVTHASIMCFETRVSGLWERSSVNSRISLGIITKTSLHKAWLGLCVTSIHFISYEIQFELRSLAHPSLIRCNMGMLHVIIQSMTLCTNVTLVR